VTDGIEACPQVCEPDYEHRKREIRAWMADLKHWQCCENRVMGIIFELENALPAHRKRLNQFRDMVMDHERLYERYARSLERARPDMIDEQCASKLEKLGRFGVAGCQDCEPECIEALSESCRQAALRHEDMALIYAQLQVEYESAMKQIQALAKRLQACVIRT